MKTQSPKSHFILLKMTRRWGQLGYALVCGLTLLLAALATLARPVYAASITVTGNGDIVAVDSFCTLREAIQAANTDLAVNECNAGSGEDTIFFSPALSGETITLAGGQLSIVTPMTLDGAAAPNLTVSGNSASRVFASTLGARPPSPLPGEGGGEG